MTETASTATPSLEVAELETERLPLSDNSPGRKLTRKHVEHLNQAYWWLFEFGEDYIEQAVALRDLVLYLGNILDIEAGIQQGYLDSEGTPSRPKAV